MSEWNNKRAEEKMYWNRLEQKERKMTENRLDDEFFLLNRHHSEHMRWLNRITWNGNDRRSSSNSVIIFPRSLLTWLKIMTSKRFSLPTWFSLIRAQMNKQIPSSFFNGSPVYLIKKNSNNNIYSTDGKKRFTFSLNRKKDRMDVGKSWLCV